MNYNRWKTRSPTRRSREVADTHCRLPCAKRHEIKQMTLYEYFDRIAIIHLPERQDRYDSLCSELRGLGIGIRQPKVQIPHAPVPEDWSGWPSRGVYGNFLSHLGILRGALEDGLKS